MIPAIMNSGRSFKGAALYYLHDKQADTTERVAWVEIINLPTADPDRAWRMMAHTAMAQTALKEASGIKATGRKLDKPVLAYSLSWHPSETPTRGEMTGAALETLKVLGLDSYQAMIVCHDDEPHPHVHILVNRVNPHDGRAAPLSMSKRKLSEWALKYEQARGQILAEKRLENAEKRKRGEQTYDPRVPRSQFELNAANDNLTAAFIRAEWKQRAAMLYREERAARQAMDTRFKVSHQSYGQALAELKRKQEAAIEEVRTRIKVRFKPRWAAQFRDERKARKSFEGRERNALGKIWNMVATVRELREGGRKSDESGKTEGGAFDVLFTVLNGKERLIALERRLERIRRRLIARQGEAVREGIREVRAQFQPQFDAARQQFLGEMISLRRDEQEGRDIQKEAWRDYNRARSRAFRQIADRERANVPQRDREPEREKGPHNERDTGGRER